MQSIIGTIILKAGREKPVRQRHPWVFSGAISRVDGDPQPGDLVGIADSRGKQLAIGYYNPHSQIRVRILAWQSRPDLPTSFWEKKLQVAYNNRGLRQFQPETTAYRLVNAEADHLPGLIVDRYNDYLVVQLLTFGIDHRRELLIERLAEMRFPDGGMPVGIIERSDAQVRQKEGLTDRSGLLWGTAPDQAIPIQENGLRFYVHLMDGHKTGFYLDQRNNRALFAQPSWVAGRRILNVFSYTGGFAIYAASGGASDIINIDSSRSALELAEENMKLNHPQRTNDEYLLGDAFEILRHYRDTGEKFDLVILDPPKFVHSRAELNRATRGYKDINLLAMKILSPNGLLATFSCSGLLSADLFQKIIFGAALDARRAVQLWGTFTQGEDHPVLLTFPESAYLKGLLCHVQ